MIVAQGARRVSELVEQVRQADVSVLPDLARSAVLMMADQLDALAAQIHALERRLLAWHRDDQASQRLATIPGVGIITATALSASIPDPGLFRSGREFSAFLGLVPRQNSSGGKDRLGRISKMGDGYLRKLLVVGATSVIRRARTSASVSASWVKALLERRPARVVTVAMANKTARIAWAVLARGEVYRPAAMA
jgi:transposase